MALCRLPDPGEVVVVFRDLPPGRYGIAALHDLNSNGEMDNNLLGFPKEPFGFGNDARIKLAPPAFADMAVTVGDGVTATVVNLGLIGRDRAGDHPSRASASSQSRKAASAGRSARCFGLTSW